MNPGGPPGQMTQAAAHNGQQAASHTAKLPNFFRPEMMRQIPLLSEEEKIKYEAGLRTLWNILDSPQATTTSTNEARSKIREFSSVLHNKLREREANMNASPQQPQTPAQPTNTQEPGGANSQAAPANKPNTQKAPSAAGAHAQAQTGATAGAVRNAVPGRQSGRAQGTQADALLFHERVKQEVYSYTWIPSTEIASQGPQAIENWERNIKDRYVKAVESMRSTASSLKQLETARRNKTAKGEMTPELAKQLDEQKEKIQSQQNMCKEFIQQSRKHIQPPSRAANHNAHGGPARPSSSVGAPAVANQAPNQNQNQPVRPGPSPQQQPASGDGPNNVLVSQQSTSQVNAAFEMAKSQQAAAANRLSGANGHPGQQQPHPQAPLQAVTTSAVQRSPVTAPHPTPVMPASQPVKVEPGQQAHPHPPPVNTAIASAAAAGIPSGGTPTQNSARAQTPQIATPTTGAPRSLSHQAAVIEANKRGSQPLPSTGQLQHPNQQHQHTPQGPSGGTPSSAGVMGTTAQQAQQQQGPAGHPHAHPSQQQHSYSSKLPIPKVLPEKATMPPQAVVQGGGVAPGRPTYTAGGGIAGGVMGSAAVAKMPTITLEGEGERVLNRKKLDELVRSVCGGQAEGQEGNLLTPDVEDCVLEMADTFVDSVLHAACRMSKERGSKVLEIRDIQHVLERVYNIRVPGYSSDELRTVRKVQPAPGWITKMSAIQAAKVMPGKGDM